MACKQPWFPWYVDDWLADEKLRACSMGARGLWADLLSLMHKNDLRGYLQVNGKPPSPEQLARMTGCSAEEVSRLLAELTQAGVPSALADGTLYSRRMVRDEHKARKCAAAGKRGGGNPRLKGGTDDTYKGAPKGEDKGESKPPYKHASGSGVCSSSSFSESETEQDTHPTGVGGPGEGPTFIGGSKGVSKGLAVDALSRDFDRFWNAYPRKQAKMEARVAWDKLSPDPPLVETILRAVERQSQSSQWKRGILPNAAAWLTGCRWEDEVAAAVGTPVESIEQRIARARAEQCGNGPTG